MPNNSNKFIKNNRILKNKLKMVNPEKIILALEERVFCVVLQKNGKIESIEARNVDEFLKYLKTSSVVWMDYVVEDFKKEIFKVTSSLGFKETLIRNLLKNDARSAYEDFEDEMGILIPTIIVEGFEVRLDPLLILIKENMIVTLHTTEAKRFFRLRRYAGAMMRKLSKHKLKQDKITKILIRIIDENNARNFDYLREIEEQGDKLSEALSNPKTPREFIGKQIHKMKHALVVYLGGLWATIDALNSLRYGDADLITDDQKILNGLSGLIYEVNSHINLAEHLSDVLASGLEVVQSIYNNQLQILNNRLAILVAYLTIIGTALLVPNTIATIVSGPMFEFTPADLGWYIPFLVVSTIVATITAWAVVKKMGLLPGKPDSG